MPTANMLVGGTDAVFSRTDSAGTRTLMHDGLGSAVGLLDANGATTTSYAYEPFGATNQTGAASNNSSKYTGREDDGTGLYYYRARYYSPTLQRFISEDPIGFAGGDVNLYGYVGNDPINFTDPSGLAQDPNVILDQLQIGLGIGGMIPGLGEIFDGADTLISLARGDEKGAALGAASMIPGAGWGAGITKIGRRLPINWRYAGKNFPASKLPTNIQSKYPNGVNFTNDGFPNFAPYFKTNVQVDGLIGDTYYDFLKANKKAGYTDTPAGYTWHHHENCRTMQLVPTDLHSNVKHSGGASKIRNGIK